MNIMPMDVEIFVLKNRESKTFWLVPERYGGSTIRHVYSILWALGQVWENDPLI